MKPTTKLRLLDFLQDAVVIAGVVALALIVLYGLGK